MKAVKPNYLLILHSATSTAACFGLFTGCSKQIHLTVRNWDQVLLSQWCSSGQFSFCGSSVSWCSISVTYSQHNLGPASVREPSCKLSPFPVGCLSGNTTPDLYSAVHVGTTSVTISVFVFTTSCCFSSIHWSCWLYRVWLLAVATVPGAYV